MQPHFTKPPQTPSPLVVHQLVLSSLIVVAARAADELRNANRRDIAEQIETALASAKAVA